MKDYVLCLGNISQDFKSNNMKKKNRIKTNCKFFLVDLSPVDTNDILDIHKNLMKETWYKIMFGLIKKIVYEIIT